MNDQAKAVLRKWMTRENMAVAALLGLLLMVIALPSGKGEEEKEETARAENVGEAQTDQDGEKELLDYVGYLENRLEQLLTGMEGVGRVQVMITLSSSEEQVVEKDVPSSMDHTSESDNAGGTREVTGSGQEENTVFMTEADGSRTPYVRKTLEPVVKGVTVVAQGGGDARIQKDITEVVQALFGVEAHKIKVVKMK